MASVASRPALVKARAGISQGDSVLVVFALLHAALLVLWPVAPVIAVGVWWSSNTIAHNFIHRPFFRSAAMNRLFSGFLSLVLGIPQTLWRERHLAHHSERAWPERAWRLRWSRNLVIETCLVVCLWVGLVWFDLRFFLTAYVPGYLAGLGLCWAQGYWEHAAHEPVSHYGRLYNWLCFNDGYHAEHHTAPGTHWTLLSRVKVDGAASSDWAPLLRWLDERWSLTFLEELVLHSPWLQRFVLRVHARAFRSLLEGLPAIGSVTIVGGGLFPRTALILRELLPGARLVIADCDSRNLERARGWLRGDVEYRCERFVVGESFDTDLTVIPLCFEGEREAVYREAPSRFVLVHDWIWRRRGVGAVVSGALLKRVNLVRK